jgi:hypothetical protein
MGPSNFCTRCGFAIDHSYSNYVTVDGKEVHYRCLTPSEREKFGRESKANKETGQETN